MSLISRLFCGLRCVLDGIAERSDTVPDFLEGEWNLGSWNDEAVTTQLHEERVFDSSGALRVVVRRS